MEMVGFFLVQASEEDRSRVTPLSTRIVMLTGLVFGFLLVNFLSANLTSSISVRRDDVVLNTLEVSHNN